MESVDKIEFARDLVSCCDGGGGTRKWFCSRTDKGVKEPCGVEFGNTDKSSDVIVQNDVDVQTTCNPFVRIVEAGRTNDRLERGRYLVSSRLSHILLLSPY